MKGKCYTETLSKFYRSDVLQAKGMEYMVRLAGLFSEHLVTDDEMALILKDCREAEFTGTSYMPLPDEGALVRIIKDVQVRTATKRMNEPESPKQEFTEEAGRMICGDGEIIIRDNYFFRNMFLMGDLLGGNYPLSWIEEAFNLMDDTHKEQYRASGDVDGKRKVMADYFTKLKLEPREAYEYNDCSKARDSAGNWFRYINQ